MDADFWIKKWENDQIGFHQNQVNPSLVSRLDGVNLNGKTVFAPLCGKSLDLLWLKNKGAKVVGCELSKKAVESFFEENGLDFKKESVVNGLELYRGGGVEIYQGDFFGLAPTKFDLVYDRAALIALPPKTRTKYASRLKRFLGKNAMMLLICIQYDQTKMSGPPFSVDKKEVLELYKGLEIKEVASEGPMERSFKEATVSLEQKVYEIKS